MQAGGGIVTGLQGKDISLGQEETAGVGVAGQFGVVGGLRVEADQGCSVIGLVRVDQSGVQPRTINRQHCHR